MKLAVLITALTAAALGVLATGLLTKGTQPAPWSIQSFGGESDQEKMFRARARRYFVAGMSALALAFVCSAASSLLDYLKS